MVCAHPVQGEHRDIPTTLHTSQEPLPTSQLENSSFHIKKIDSSPLLHHSNKHKPAWKNVLLHQSHTRSPCPRGAGRDSLHVPGVIKNKGSLKQGLITIRVN